MSDSVLWFRRDLRLDDNPALLAAVDAAARDGGVLPLFVLDHTLLDSAGAPRQAFLLDCVRALADDVAARGTRLVVRSGDPATVVPMVAAEVGAGSVHVTDDHTPYAVRRDRAVERALDDAGAQFVRTGSPYAVTPGRVRKSDGSPYQVFTPFHRAWAAHGWRPPAAAAPRRWPVPSAAADGEELPASPDVGAAARPAGEAAARAAWAEFAAGPVDRYAENRDRPDLDATSHMSAYLHLGCIHPRTMLADLADRRAVGVSAYRRELAFREFYADVLWHRPDSAWGYYVPRFAGMRYDTGGQADRRFEAWTAGRTGYPLVDAGMRQLLAEGWLPNRVRMVVASFLVKDLHIEWQRGARHFLRHLVDGDVASNQHNWQWVAGSGTDAAPYHRIFNPVAQAERFDPDGDYVRRYVPELRELAGAAVHQPWRAAGGLPGGYVERIVDHGVERAEALARYADVRT